VGTLKLALEVETREHKRAGLLLGMLEDHMKRVGDLRTQSTTTMAAGDGLNQQPQRLGGGAAAGAAIGSERPVTSFAASAAAAPRNLVGGVADAAGSTTVELLSYCGLLLGVAVCGWALCCASPTTGTGKEKRRSRRNKDNSHVV
jgi:hypothetical protein